MTELLTPACAEIPTSIRLIVLAIELFIWCPLMAIGACEVTNLVMDKMEERKKKK